MEGSPLKELTHDNAAMEGPNAHQTVVSGFDEISPERQHSNEGSSVAGDVWEGELSHVGMRITFQNLDYFVRNRSNRSEKLPILRSISGFYLPAEMSAVMGPSGSGKSLTLRTPLSDVDHTL